jgi:ABC-2 type transport system permease protein
MFHALIKKYWSESWLLWSACAFILPLFCWMRIWIVSQFELSRLEPLLEQLKPFEKFSPVPVSQFLTYAGSIAMTFDEPVVILCVLVWAIARGSDVVSGEIHRGTMEMLLAQPITRRGIMFAHGLVSISGLALLCILVWIGIFFGIETLSIRETPPAPSVQFPWLPIEIPLSFGPSTNEPTWVPLRDRVDSLFYLPPTLNLFGFAYFVFGLSVLFSSMDKYRWRTIGIVISLYILQFMLYLLGKSTPVTSWALNLTFFSAYRPDDIVRVIVEQPDYAWAWLHWDTAGAFVGLGPLGYSVLLIACGAMFHALGVAYFHRRDLPAPL